MISFTVKITPTTVFYEEAKELLMDVACKTRQESGCHTYNINELVEANGKASLFIYEIFSSQEDFDFHIAQDYTKNLLNSLEGNMELPFEIKNLSLLAC